MGAYAGKCTGFSTCGSKVGAICGAVTCGAAMYRMVGCAARAICMGGVDWAGRALTEGDAEMAGLLNGICIVEDDLPSAAVGDHAGDPWSGG